MKELKKETCPKMVEILTLAYRELLRQIEAEKKRTDGPIKRHRLPRLIEKAECLQWMIINEEAQ